jgi:hypothetical protein
MSAFAEKNGDVRAVGNGSMNARGDIIDAKGNVKIPSQTISRAVADIQNNQSKQVSLKADEVITSTPQVPALTIVSTRDITTENGLSTEIEYSDGSIQVVPKEQPKPTSL